MTDIVEETEPESSFKETNKKQKRKAIADAPKAIQELPRETEVDRDDDFSDDDDDDDIPEKEPQNELKDFTFIPGKNPDDNKGHTFLAKSMNADVDMSKLGSIEKIREYLENELGSHLLIKVYPIIKAFGDDILFMDKMQDLKEKLKHLLSGS